MIARWFVTLFGVIVLGIGLYAVVEPIGLRQFAELFTNPAGLWTAVALRLTIGALLWLSAPAAKTPKVLKVLSVLFFLSALALPVIGVSGLRDIVEWGTGLPNLVLRTVGAIAAAFGGFLIWSVFPRRSGG